MSNFSSLFMNTFRIIIVILIIIEIDINNDVCMYVCLYVCILYVILEDLGVLKKKVVENYCKPNGFLGVHPDRGNPGIIESTGSLGHGLSMSVGMALAERGGKSKILASPHPKKGIIRN